MSATVLNHVRKGFYLDSVALMRLSRTIADMDGVEEAALMMGTPANKQIMADAGLLEKSGHQAEGGDLVVGIRARSANAAQAALAEASTILDRPANRGRDQQTWRPRTISGARRWMPEANLALISVPGDFAAAEARKALRGGLNVMIFSDNVTLEDEIALKREARDLGLLVMGPDCGTAIINGQPLAFANKVPRGDIGIVGASGTGTQEVSCLIAQGGGGISQAIGVGGRDLSEEVGGITTLMALDALDQNPNTGQIVLISKPPARSVVSRIAERIAASGKAHTVCFIGAENVKLPDNATLTVTLKEAAENALGGRRIGEGFSASAPERALPLERRQVQGLFTGGTLCAEAQAIFRSYGQPVSSNAPIPSASHIEKAGNAHTMIDLGADEYTQGRPHPMIDPTVRDVALAKALADPSTGVILLDIVIGYGAHSDPAGHLVGVVGANRPADGPTVVASVTGTDEDPQGRSRQIATLETAGILVAPSNADAAVLALAHIQGQA
ncbi:MAG: acyl-CoA synthetase FdrA [Proteobacteria bacterium]|nr:acyl-CoA synthetase FdrA [Pseudomonadota bacterium]